MAKIGNEAKLILKLAEERIEAQKKANNRSAEAAEERGKFAFDHQTRGLDNALSIFKGIYLELES